jgi:hypothetical protein
LEGAIRHQSTNTHPILVILLWTTIGSFLHGVDGMNVKVGDLLVNYRKILHSLNDFVELSGNLLNQKLVSSIVAGCGWATKNAMQLAHRLALLVDQNGWMNDPKVDEVICKMLKCSSSETMFHNIVITG